MPYYRVELYIPDSYLRSGDELQNDLDVEVLAEAMVEAMEIQVPGLRSVGVEAMDVNAEAMDGPAQD